MSDATNSPTDFSAGSVAPAAEPVAAAPAGESAAAESAAAAESSAPAMAPAQASDAASRLQTRLQSHWQKSFERSLSGSFDYRRNALGETIITTIVALLVLVLVYSMLSENSNPMITAVALTGLVTVAFVTIRYTISPDRLRAVQTKRTLSLVSKTLPYMRGGLSPQNCQEVCELLLPESQAMAVAMTDDRVVMGYAGRFAEHFPIGSPIHTQATHRVLASQKTEVFETSSSIGMDRDALGSKTVQKSSQVIPSGIVAPLIVRGKSVGTIKLYFEAPHLIDETQLAIAEGLAEVLSTQLAIAELDKQVELATKAELQALQSQINPHFLFNTINTIASLIRTDPTRARTLLREFAVFYRQTLENSNDLINLERELQQTERYLGFEIARFGDERIKYQADIEPGLAELRVPSFIIQPIVENSVNHAFKSEGALSIKVCAKSIGADVVISVSDDGTGMTAEQARCLLANAGPTDAGTGIALRNVDARLKACFAPGSGVTVESRLGEGTVVTLQLLGVKAESSQR